MRSPTDVVASIPVAEFDGMLRSKASLDVAEKEVAHLRAQLDKWHITCDTLKQEIAALLHFYCYPSLVNNDGFRMPRETAPENRVEQDLRAVIATLNEKLEKSEQRVEELKQRFQGSSASQQWQQIQDLRSALELEKAYAQDAQYKQKAAEAAANEAVANVRNLHADMRMITAARDHAEKEVRAMRDREVKNGDALAKATVARDAAEIAANEAKKTADRWCIDLNLAREVHSKETEQLKSHVRAAHILNDALNAALTITLKEVGDAKKAQ